MGLFTPDFELKTPEQFASMRQAGLVTRAALDAVSAAVAPGLTTADLDRIAEDVIRSHGAVPSFKGYSDPPYPASICSSVNEVVVHGIPNDRVIHEGDIVSIDCGAIVDGWHGDAAVTVAVGEVPAEVATLLEVTEESMWRGIAAARVGGRIGDVGAAVTGYVKRRGRYGVVEDYVGHGIGSEMHMEPSVPNFGRPGRGAKIVEGMALAIEPMLTLGTKSTEVLDDEWTVVTVDGSWAAHFENTVCFTATGLWVTTALDGGRAQLERLGIPFGGAEERRSGGAQE